MERVAIIGGCRTPFVKAGGVFKDASFQDLGAHVVKEALKKIDLDPMLLDELVFSTVLLDPRTPNAAREIVLKSGLPKTLTAHFVSNNCISGLVALNSLSEGIKAGRIGVGLGGGSESMSRPTLTLHPKAEALFLKLSRARSLGERLQIISQFRPKLFLPEPPSPKEPSTGLTMGQHCEITAKEYGVDRASQDAWALRSHQNAFKAEEAGFLSDEIVAFNGQTRDNLVRGDTSLERLEKLRPVFDRSEAGTLTAGNSSALTDGASSVVVASESVAKRENLPILGFIEAVEFSAIDANDGLLMAPGVALPRLLHRTGVTVEQIDRFEIHEAFSAQVISNRMVWEKGWAKYGIENGIGAIPDEKTNVNGGSIAIGHPFAATGGRLVLSLAKELERSNLSTGVISVCAAGAMACAMLIRRG